MTSLARRRRPMLHNGEGDYRVGYGRPPLQTQFKRGQSGNPEGRPRGAKNLGTLLNEALNEVVVVNENGGRKPINKRKAAFKQLVNEAAKGNWRALKLLVDILQDIERRSEPQTEEASFSLADAKVLAALEARLSSRCDDREPVTDRVRGASAAGSQHLRRALLLRSQPADRARDELASRGHRRQIDRGAPGQDPTADYQSASPPSQIADGLDRVPGLV